MSDLQGLLRRLVELLEGAGVPFMIAGSFASAAHGLPRTTQDLAVVIDPPSTQALELMVGSMPTDEYYVDADAARESLRRRSMFNVVDHSSGWKIDFTSTGGSASSTCRSSGRRRKTRTSSPDPCSGGDLNRGPRVDR